MPKVLIALAVISALAASLSAADPARAAFPGKNGRIAFTTTVGDDTTESYVHAINPDGSQLKEIHGNGDAATFSPRGRRVVFADPYGEGLRLKRADGSGRTRRLTSSGLYPEWAPDGKRIVFTSYDEASEQFRSELRIYRAGTTRQLIDGGEYADWSVEGQIAFQSTNGLEAHSAYVGPGIYVIAPDASGLRRVVEGGGTPDWSPDGRRIVFRDSSGFVSVVRSDGSGLRRLRRGSQPAFSPDGHKIVYMSPRGLTIMGSGGKNPHRVPNSGKPDWSGDGVQSDPDWQPLPRQRG